MLIASLNAAAVSAVMTGAAPNAVSVGQAKIARSLAFALRLDAHPTVLENNAGTMGAEDSAEVAKKALTVNPVNAYRIRERNNLNPKQMRAEAASPQIIQIFKGAERGSIPAHPVKSSNMEAA